MEIDFNCKALHHTNICFDCKNATGGCEWADHFDPVPGWDAEIIERDFRVGKYFPVILSDDPERVNILKPSYFITACPKFIHD